MRFTDLLGPTCVDRPQQVQRLIDLGVPDLAGLDAAAFAALADDLLLAGAGSAGAAALAVHPSLVPAAELAGSLRRRGKPGFVVVDMDDLAEFSPADGVVVPDRPLYLLDDVERGDEMRGWSPDEAVPAITAAGRSPLTVSEGISWLLAQPDRLEPNHCFMTAGSRRRKGAGLDARTPAIWISGGTGRDGADRRGAPKVGWCWAGNRHTWLGFASTAGRRPLTP